MWGQVAALDFLAGGFYAIYDPAFCGDDLEPARAMLRGGAKVLQLRAKNLTDDALLTLAHQLRRITNEHDAAFVVNDRLDVALLSKADGLHVGQDDLPVPEIKELAPNLPVGLSTHNLAQARAAVAKGADMIGFGPVFDTTTKENPDPTVGLDALREVCAAVDVPVIAIGGITSDTVRSVYDAGAWCACAISAVLRADDIEAAARAMGHA